MTRLIDLNNGWRFRRIGRAGATDEAWRDVDLPHEGFVPDLDGVDHWRGECEYTRDLEAPPTPPGWRFALHVGAAMHAARVFVDGREIGRHEGGYLPFEIDLTDALTGRATVALLLRLDNRDAPDIPPGKPLEDLDFCWYAGLYRDVELRVRPPVHITDAVAADEVAGGGVFIRTTAVENGLAHIAARVHVRNCAATPTAVIVRAEVIDDGAVVARAEAPLAPGAGGAAHAPLALTLDGPRLWSPDAPSLYHMRVTVLDEDGGMLDERVERFGVRRIAFSRSGGFQINGRRMRLRGANRHQEFPRAGYAAPRAAQYRDARRIKEAGFDYVRLSHYPQSPDFLDACDEFGLVVMNPIPGWQFMGGGAFRAACLRNARELIRRDRNHPCVVLWELSLNETMMDEAFMSRLHAIGHEEMPGDQMFTCGWMDHYDVFIHARQHGRIHAWRNGDKALVVSEYGDWEYYAANEGFDQKSGAGVLARWSNSRHFRGEGERALRQQAWNHALALDDVLSSPAVLDGQWAVFDHARGYDPVRAAVGVMDAFRLPKFSFYLYRSQRDANEGGPNWAGGPVVYIASHWTPASDLRVLVYGNCEEVELRLDGALVGRAAPSRSWMAQHLPHPPFVFDLPRFVPGTLEAVALIGGRRVARHAVSTPGEAREIELVVDDAGIPCEPAMPDLLVAHARVVDASGVLCVDDSRTIAFVVTGGARVLGPLVVEAEAGIASIVLRVPAGGRGFRLRAQHPGWGDRPAAEVWHGLMDRDPLVAAGAGAT